MIYFIGAGPGAPDLITVRGMRLLQKADVVIYAGSLVNPELLAYCRPETTIYNSASMTLEETVAAMQCAPEGATVVRLHTGDPCLYGAIAEQMRELDRLGLAYEVVPGVSSFCGAAAAIPAEYTPAEVSQTLIITRMAGRTPVPEQENLRALGEAGLDELRFNLGASGCADKVIENIAMAKKYIRYVGIETPMTPELYETFMKKKDKILATGFDFMNCAELHLNPNNIDNYEGESLYMARQGYISPIWSRDLTLSLMETAVRENWKPLIHDCSNRTKFARDLNLRAHEGGWFGASSYGSEFPRIPYAAFLPTLRDAELQFAEEEPMPVGYRPGDIVL